MTAYNREKYIAQAIESVIASTYENWELIIVDDVSTDSTVEIAKSYIKLDSRIRVYINEKNLGDYFNRNKAASYATGKYLKYLDSDDIMYPHGLEVFVKGMEKFPEAAFGLCSIYDPKTPYPTLLNPKEIYLEHFNNFKHFLRAPGSAIIRRDIFESIGGFSGKRLIGDTELWLKLSKNYSMVKVNVDLYWARAHPNQESKMFSKSMKNIGDQIIMEYLKRSDCPLNALEIKQIIKKEKIRKLKSKFDTIIKNISKS